MGDETGQFYEFGPFRLNPAERELQRGGKRVPLPPKAFDTLVILVRNSGHLLGKDELIKALWPDSFVEEGSLSNNIFMLRKALGDNPVVIETVPRRGYRFVANLRRLPSAPLSVTGITRLIVVPFRMLRPDPDRDFLAFSVPDAVVAALSGLGSLVVRSTTVALRYASDSLDLERIAREAEVDVVLTGTMIRSGEAIRTNCQLVEVPGGTVRWSLQLDIAFSDLFRLQDYLVERIVGSLAPSLTDREHRLLKHDVPANAAAYEFYLRGNELGRRGLAGAENLGVARDLYLRSVDEDRAYAPAWARLGRCYLLIGKGIENPEQNFALAESAFQRALELNPYLQLAHSLYARLKAETGRAEEAMTGLLARARSGPAEAELFATLVQCCRYCGLTEASLAAHKRARSLDPQISTSVIQTFYQTGDYESALLHVNSGVWMTDAQSLDSMGRPQEALALLRARERSGIPAPMRFYVGAWRALLEGKVEESLEAAEQAVLRYIDPEGIFYMALVMARIDTERAIKALAASFEKGFSSVQALTSNGWLRPLQSDPKFRRILQRVQARCRHSARAYEEAGGPQVLGVNSPGEFDQRHRNSIR